MFGKIVGLISGLMCAFPFWIIGTYNKDSREPISFWSGDTSLRTKVTNVKEYNHEMAKLYRKCALAFVVMGLLLFVNTYLGMIVLVFNCTLGVYIVWRAYKKILGKYS